MGSDFTANYSRLVGIGLPDPRVQDPAASLWDAQSDYNEASSRPGQPAPQSDTEAVLVASGEQASGGALEVQALGAGMPGPAERAVGVVWRNEGDTYWRGRDAPSVMTHWESITYGSVITVNRPHAVTLSDGRVVVVHERVFAGAYSVTTNTRATDGTWGAAVTVESQSSAPTFDWNPCLVVLPGDRLLCFFWVDGDTDEEQIRLYYSDDAGATWTKGQDFCLIEALDVSGSPGSGIDGYDPGRIRAAYNPASGNLCVVAEVKAHDTDFFYRDLIIQWASDDLGVSLVQKGLSDTSGSLAESAKRAGKYIDISAHDGGFLFAHIHSANLEASVRRIGSAFDDVTAVDPVELSSPGVDAGTNGGGVSNIEFTDGDLSLVIDDDGAAYIYCRGASDRSQGFIYRSFTGSATSSEWDLLGHSDLTTGGKWYDINDSSTYIQQFAVTPCQGRMLMAHTFSASPGTADASLCAAYLAGPSTVTMANARTYRSDVNQGTWDRTYLPFDLPADVGFTRTGSSSSTYENLSGGALLLQTDNTNANQFYTISPSGAVVDGCYAVFRVTPTSGGTLTSDEIGFSILVADGTEEAWVSIFIDTTGFQVYDRNAPGNVGSAVLPAGGIDTTGIEILAALDIPSGVGAARFACWYRTTTAEADREWTPGPSSTTITVDTTSPASGNQIRFGHGPAGGVTHTSEWTRVAYLYGSNVGQGLAGGQTNPDALFPQQVTTYNAPLDGTTRIAGRDGPAYIGDSWDIDASADYRVQRAFPAVEPSPRRGWRSSDETKQEISIQLDPSGVGDVGSLAPNSAIVIGLMGINWRTGTVYRKIGGGLWSSMASIDAATRLSGLRWTRTGQSLKVSGSGTSTSNPFLFEDEFAGSTFDLDGTLRRIKAHTAGWWKNDTTRQPWVQLSGVDDGADAASGTAGAIWAPDVALIIPMDNALAGIKIEIDAQSTVDGYFTIGSMFVGYLMLAGQNEASGRSVEHSANIETFTSTDLAAVRTRVNAPASRVWEMPWNEFMPVGAVTSEVSPDYVRLHSSLPPIVARQAWPEQLAAVPGILDGTRYPAMMFREVQINNSAVQTFNRRRDFVYGLASTTIRQESMYREMSSGQESFRVPTLSIQELV